MAGAVHPAFQSKLVDNSRQKILPSRQNPPSSPIRAGTHPPSIIAALPGFVRNRFRLTKRFQAVTRATFVHTDQSGGTDSMVSRDGCQSFVAGFHGGEDETRFTDRVSSVENSPPVSRQVGAMACDSITATYSSYRTPFVPHILSKPTANLYKLLALKGYPRCRIDGRSAKIFTSYRDRKDHQILHVDG